MECIDCGTVTIKTNENKHCNVCLESYARMKEKMQPNDTIVIYCKSEPFLKDKIEEYKEFNV